jgi:hypothetical protein
MQDYAGGIAISLPRTFVLAAAVLAVQRTPQFENGDVKVWKVVVTPHGPLSMHAHEDGRAIIPLEGGTARHHLIETSA